MVMVERTLMLLAKFLLIQILNISFFFLFSSFLDVSRSTHSNLSLRAFRFSQAFMEAQKEDKFTTESLIKNKLTFSNIFEELPITVKNSHLVTALLHSLDDYEHIIPKSTS